jgi:hypothetical protein
MRLHGPRQSVCLLAQRPVAGYAREEFVAAKAGQRLSTNREVSFDAEEASN